mmetsp:Transcript_13929/g.25149  ORF Transcript_13929/g.25149 Transcript_13929/m.25149 type:complete len:291 (-) Transcript_13929:138-1010(-)
MTDENLLKWLFCLCLFWGSLCFVVSTATGNVSQVDKLWSIVPAIYAWVIAFAHALHPRSLMMAVLATGWSIRLTFNFARRGGYSWPPWLGEEDYRWPILRKHSLLKHPLAWMAFNLGFISLYQMLLLLLIVLPQTLANKSTTINMFDLLLAVMFVVLLCLEYQADQQQYDFQTEKYRQIGRKINRKGEYLVGFVRTGLWSISRHPNYFCEQSLWLVYYLFSVTAGNDLVNWSGIGIFLLILLFKGSAAFSEGITAAKYPEYGVYQATVPLFIPYKLSLYRAFVNQGVKSE